MLSILLLAAGASSRMRGGDKLLEEVDGAPLLRTLAMRSLDVCDTVIVTLPPKNAKRLAALDGLKVTTALVQDAYLGMAHSLRAGIDVLHPTASGVVIFPADMPDLSAEDLQLFANAHSAAPETIFRGVSETGQPGHPVLFPKSCFVELGALCGDIGARDVLRRKQGVIETIALPNEHALTDLDTPEQWVSWRKSKSAPTTT
ncbi:nucleotidyltransferase family protein [Shimia sp. NS0008-38b]|uniref:nucleotidyltransferase family protein n=1 Tax=Shimia sp. NS0008-38b TaxID=3127653 RepID=UPI0031078894